VARVIDPSPGAVSIRVGGLEFHSDPSPLSQFVGPFPAPQADAFHLQGRISDPGLSDPPAPLGYIGVGFVRLTGNVFGGAVPDHLDLSRVDQAAFSVLCPLLDAAGPRGQQLPPVRAVRDDRPGHGISHPTALQDETVDFFQPNLPVRGGWMARACSATGCP
jgi:hypothetical protein